MEQKSGEMTRIFTGPALVAKGLEVRLLDIGIMAVTKNDHNSGILSGFAVGVPNQVRLFITNEQYSKAKELIDDYLKNVDYIE